MTAMSRRDLLKGGLLAAAAAGLGACGGARSSSSASGPSAYRWPTPVARRRPDSLPFPERPAGTDSLPQVEHIVVLMMENHSFDNLLGTLGRGDGFTLDARGRPTAWNPTADGRRQLAFPMPSDCQLDGRPSQEWVASHQQYAGGTNTGFVTSPSGPVAMGYWTAAQLPFTHSLARTFPLADRWFCSLLGQTYPNRRYLLAATSAGMVDDVVPQILTAGAPNGTILDRLDQHGISWRNYFPSKVKGNLPTVDVWITDPGRRPADVVDIGEFFADAAAGRLPGFCVVDPDFGHTSEEDPQDIGAGEAFAASVVDAVMHGPGWDRTLLVWLYDEHGGYYDHVPPPPALAPDAIGPLAPVGLGGASAYDGFRRYGFRVPAVVVSPWSRRDHVTHVVHDHTSILAMVERKWNLPAMTWRDANAADLTDFLDLQRPAFRDPPALAAPTATAAARAAAACTPGDPGGPIPPPGSVAAATSAG